MPYVNKPRPYKKEYEQYQGKPEQIKNRAKRNTARAELMKEGKVHKGGWKRRRSCTTSQQGGNKC